jgi:hypothetical protein
LGAREREDKPHGGVAGPKAIAYRATNTGKPLLTAVLFRELRKPPNQTIHQP